MTAEFIPYLSEILGTSHFTYKPLRGGDISSAFLLELKDSRIFLKLNSADLLPMFRAEQQGLEAIGNTQTLSTPKVLGCGSYEKYSFLLLEYIESKQPSEQDFQKLGEQLAAMHQHKGLQYGWEQDNYIGSLAQQNTPHSDWTTFYLTERILPQLELAKSKGTVLMDAKQQAKMQQVCADLLEEASPSLLHGDLWGGNYLIATDGTPYLIDPSVYYGHSEVDFAMTKLFGGFGGAFYKSYQNLMPADKHQRERIELYQLYYLLVHFNLFGGSYYDSVRQIVTRYFS